MVLVRKGNSAAPGSVGGAAVPQGGAASRSAGSVALALTVVAALVALACAALTLWPARASAAVTCDDNALSAYGPIPAPGQPVPGAPACFRISVPSADGHSASTLYIPGADNGPTAGAEIAIGNVAEGEHVSGEYWTLVTQGKGGSYWQAGTSYLLQSYQTNLCLRSSGAAGSPSRTMTLVGCDDNPTVFNVTASPGSAEFVQQIATGVFGGGEQCLDAGLPRGTFAPCDASKKSQQWTFSGPIGWLPKAQIQSASAQTCPQGGDGPACRFAPAAKAANGAAIANVVFETNTCATDPLGNPLQAFHAPAGIPASGGYSYSTALGAHLNTAKNTSSSVNASIAFGLSTNLELQKTNTTGTSGLVTALTTVYDLKNIGSSTNFTVGGNLATSYNLDTGGDRNVNASIPSIPPGDYAWFSTRNTFAAVAGSMSVPSAVVGNYSIPVPNFVLPMLPSSQAQGADASQVPIELEQGHAGGGGIIEGHYATSFTINSPADCTPATPTITDGGTYQFDNAASTFTLSGGNGKCAAGASAVQLPYAVAPDQQWMANRAGNGLYTLTNGCGLRLTDPNTSSQAGMQLTQAAPSGGADQLWRIMPIYGSDNWQLRSYASGMFIGAGSVAVGAPVVQNPPDTANNGASAGLTVTGLAQQWRLHAPDTEASGPPVFQDQLTTGNYTLTGAAAGLVLGGVKRTCAANGDTIALDRYSARPDQVWQIAANGDGTYSMINGCPFALTDPNGSTVPGTKLTQFTPTAAGSQRWELAVVPGTGKWTIKNYSSGLYATLSGGAVGATVSQQPLNAADANGRPTPGPDQQWALALSSSTPVQPPTDGEGNATDRVTTGAYELVNAVTGLTIGAQGNNCTTNGTKLNQDQYQGLASQTWNVTYNGDGTYTVANNCPMALTIPSATTASGAQLIQTTPKKGDREQLWKLTPVAGTDNWALQSYATNQYVTPSGNVVGASVVADDPSGENRTPGPDQQWQLKVAGGPDAGPPTGGGGSQVNTAVYELTNVASKLAIGASDHGCATPGTKLALDQYHGSKDQLWTISDNGNGTYTMVNACPLAATNPAASTTPGAPLTETKAKGGDAAQLWILTPVTGGHWTVQNFASDLFVTADGSSVGAGVVQQTANGDKAGEHGLDQQWDLVLAPPAPNTPPTSEGNRIPKGDYKLGNVATGMASGAGDGACTDGARLTLDQYRGRRDQLWTVSPNGDRTYTIVNRCPATATVPNSSTTPGAALTQAKAAGKAANQSWLVAPVDGTGYWTVKNLASNLYVTAAGHGVGDGVVQRTKAATGSDEARDQQWEFTLDPPDPGTPPTDGSNEVATGDYELTNVATGLAMGVTDHGCTTPGTKLAQDQYQGSKDQLWRITSNHNGTYTLVNNCPLSAADPNSSTSPGAPLTAETPGAGVNQRWVITPVTGTDHWTVQSFVSNLYVSASGDGVGDELVQQKLSGAGATAGPEQQWDLTLNPPPPSTPPTTGTDQIANGLYQLTNVSSGLALGVGRHDCATAGTRLAQDKFRGQEDQRWTVTYNGNGTYTVVNRCPLAASNPNSSTAPGTALTAARAGSGAEQMWTIAPVPGTGHWTIRNYISNQYVTADGKSVGDGVVQRPLPEDSDLPSAPQQWDLTLDRQSPGTPPTDGTNVVATGVYKLANVASGMAMGASAHRCSTAGTTLTQDQYAGRDDQLWTVTYNGNGTYTIVNRCPMAATNANSSTTPGAAVTQTPLSRAADQQWLLMPVRGTDHWTVQNFASNQYLTVSGRSVGDKLEQRPLAAGSITPAPEQQWDLTLDPPAPTTPPTDGSNQVATGVYEIASATTGLAMGTDDHDCATAGGKVTQDHYGATRDQLWTITSNGNGTYTLMNGCPMAATDPNAGTSEGTAITQTPASGKPEQLWMLRPVPGTDHWTVENYVSNQYVTAPDRHTGTGLVQRGASGADHVAGTDQWWDLHLAPPADGTPPTGTSNQVTSGVYELSNVASGLALGAEDHACRTAGASLAQDKYLAGKDQRWAITANGNGTYTLVNRCPFAATNANSSTVSGSPITHTKAGGTPSQLWVLTPVAGTNHWTVQSYVSNQFLTASGNSVGDRAVQRPLAAGTIKPTASQQWDLVLDPPSDETPPVTGSNEVTTGVYEIANVATGLALGSGKHDCTTPDTALALDRYTGSKDQLWTVTNNHDGTYTVVNRCPMAATDPKSSTTPGTPLTQQRADRGRSQLWILAPVPGTGHWTVQTYLGNLYATAGGSGLGSGVVQQTLKGRANAPDTTQQWDLVLSPPKPGIPSTGGTDKIPNGAYKITNVASRLSLGATGNDCGTNGVNLAQDRYSGAKHQVWTVKDNGNGTYTLANRCGVVMTDPNSSVAPGVKLGQYKPSRASNQLWIIAPVAATGHWTIQSYVSNLYATAAGTTVGANVTQEGANGAAKGTFGAGQEWDLTLASKAKAEPFTGSGASRVANGVYRIINASSSLSMSVAYRDCRRSDGTVVVNQFSNTADQRWRITGNSDGTYTLTSGCSMRFTDPNGSTRAGTALIQSTVRNAIAQRWRITPVPGTNNWTVRSYASNLFATAVGGAVGSMVVQSDYDAARGKSNSPLQQWTLVPATGRAAPTLGIVTGAHGAVGGHGVTAADGSGGCTAVTGVADLPLLLTVMAMLLGLGVLLTFGSRRRRPLALGAAHGPADGVQVNGSVTADGARTPDGATPSRSSGPRHRR
jgi:hypothetical protein